MQPKFTQQSLRNFFAKIIAVALIFSASTQISFAQKNLPKSAQQKPGYENILNNAERQQFLQAKMGNPTNDAGIIMKASNEIHNPQAVCTTWTVSIVSGDPVLPGNLRPFRDGVVKTCAAPGTCTTPSSTGTFHYQIFQWTCPVAQCVTVTYTATNANFTFVTVYSASPSLPVSCTNWVSDPGSSGTNGVPIVFSFNGTAGTTYYFLVNDVGTLPGNCTIQIDAGVCFAAACTGTPAPGNTIATPNPVGSGAPFTLSVQNNPPASGFTYDYQSSPTAGGPWTTISGGPIAASSFVTSQTVVTYYRVVVACTPSGQSAIATPIQVQLLACGWSNSTVSPIPILDQGVVAIGTNLYSFAGVSNGAVVATSNKFDGTVWSPIAPTPQGLEYPGVCTDGVNAYILGGASTAGASLNTLYRYNVATNTYTTLAPFTTGVWNPSAVYLNGKIYKFCGTAAASTAVMEIYDVASNTWSAGTPFPQALSFVTAIASGGFIYAAGGVSTATLTASSALYKYDPAGAGTWSTLAPMAAQHWGAAGDFYNNGFAVAGGYINGATTIGTNAELYNIGSNSWGPLPNLPTATARVGGAATGIGGSFYVIGGRTLASAGFNGSTQNQKLFCIPPNPCTGTPAPGNTLASINPVCSGTTFTLSLANNPFVSGLTYDWESGPTATGPWTNLPGVNTNITYSGSQTGATWYRCNVTCTPSGLTGTSTPLLVANGQGVFTVQPPSAVSVECGKNITISYTATGNSLTYSWEYRTSPSGFWFNVGATLAGAGVSGQTTSSITLTNVSAALNGYQLRGVIVGPCTAVDFSNIVTLTVTPYIVNVNPTSATICAGTLQQLTITNTIAGALSASFSSGPISIPIPDNVATPTTTTITVSGIPAGSVITNVRVHLNMAHTYPADMVLNLKGPAAANILSLYKHNTNTDNGASSIPTAGFYDAVCSKLGATQWKAVPTPYRYGITAPTGPFAADALNGVTNPGYTIMDPIGWVSNATTFNSLMPVVGAGSDPNGVWTLAMCDGGPGDLGTLTLWSIDFDYVAPIFATGVWTSAPAAPNTMWATAAGSGGAAYVAGTPATSIWVNPIVNTNYTVVVTTPTPCVSNPTTIPVTVITPLTGLVPPANKTVCVGTNTSFTVGGSGGPFTYLWEVSVNSGLTWTPVSGATTATLSLNAVTQLMNNNLYRVTINGGPCGSTTTAAARLNVNQLPVVTISASTLQLIPGRVATITGSSVPAAVAPWSWTLNGTAIAGTTNSVTANIDQQGNYQATVTDVNGCTNSSNIVTIGAEASEHLWIYPNPNTGKFEVRLYYNRAYAEKRIAKIYTITGQLVASKEFDLFTNSHPYLSINFDLGIQSAGTYVVKVVDKYSKHIASGLVVIQ